ncbi:putative N-acetyltransferase YjaB [compost metagenome]
MNEDYIEGIFVDEKHQSKGIGKDLVDYVKNLKKELNLNVFKKNQRAVKFYIREKFSIIDDIINEDNGEEEYIMNWKFEK